MEVLQGMSPDRMVIIFPSALVAMYFIISLQKSLSGKASPYLGLIIPVVCFVASTILAIRPLLVAEPGEFEGLGMFCLRMWLTFNIATIVFLFPYIRERKIRKELIKAYAEEEARQNSEPDNPDTTE